MTKSGSDAIFNTLPVQVDILNANLQVTQRLYLLGDQPKSIRDIVSKEGIYSKKLDSVFGFKADKISGGDVDWEDLDDEDFETIINAELPEEEVNESNIKQETFVETAERIDYSINIFGEDAVSDLQKKIAVVTKIDPAKQYLSVARRCMSHYVNFQAAFDSNYVDQLDLIEFLQECQTKIKDMPVDENYVLTKYNSIVVNTLSTKLSSFLNGNNHLHISLISLDIIVPNKNAMQFLLRSDKQSFELIFESVVERFFIMMNTQMFTEYLANNELDFDIGRYKTMIDNQTKIITQLNKIPKVSASDKNLTITTNAVTLRSESSKNAILILPKLFNNFAIFNTDGAFYLDLFMTNNNRLMQARKVSKYAAQAINFVEGVSMNIRPLASHVREYKIRDRIVITLLPSGNFSKLIMSIDIFGQVEIIAFSTLTTEITNQLVIKEVSNSTKHIIDYINTLNSAFISTLKLDSHLSNYKMLKSTSNLIFSQRFDYDNVIKYMISDLSTTGILEVDPVSNVNMRQRVFTIHSDDGDRSIQVTSNSKLAVFTLIDLSVDETSFYIDLIGRFVKHRATQIEIKLANTNSVQAVDPVLFKYKSKANINYSRVCQKRFQPMIANATDSNAYKYHNFTFNEPQYYKCPTKDNPFLGLMPGYHPNGYCLPCCRKQPQINRESIINNCISGEPVEEPVKLAKSSNKYYVIDYPNDLIANSRLVSRVSNVPDFINKMLTKGSKLLINGISIPYNETDLHMQTINILVQYLHKKTSRDLIMDILEYLKDRSNHRKIMAMGNIGYAFNSIDSLKQGLADRFLKQTILKSAVHSEKLNQTPINWNDIIIDLAISMGIGIALLSDNRIKASDCAHVVSQAEECSDEPITTLNASIKLLKLEYINFDQPILMILRRVDTEYSKVHNNRQYYYYPIISGSIIDPKINALQLDTVMQLKKIKIMTYQPTNTIIDRSFNYRALTESIQSIGKVVALYEDADNNIAYSDIVIKPARSLLVSLYRSPNDTQTAINLKKYTQPKSNSYSGTVSDVIKLIECHNNLQLATIDTADFQTYLSINTKKLLSNQMITFPLTKKCLLKIDKFIIHSNMIVGTKVCGIFEKTCVHSIIFYHKHIAITDILKLLTSKQQELSKLLGSKLTKTSTNIIASTALDLVHRSTNSYYNTKVDPFAPYFCEYIIDPIQLIDNIPNSINYPSNSALKQAQYMNNIYKIMINALIVFWRDSKPTELIEAIIQLVNNTKPDILRAMSNNLIEDWSDQLINKFSDKYHANVIRAEIYEFCTFIQNNARVKTKDSIIAILSGATLTLNDIELHNLAYTRKDQIIQLIQDTASKCLVQTNTIPEIALTHADNIFEQYKDKAGKILILKSIYNDLLDLAVSDLSNPFRREYILDNCMINSFVNSVKIRSHIDELIYMQEL